MESNCPTCGSNVVQILTGHPRQPLRHVHGLPADHAGARAASPAHAPSERDQLPATAERPLPAAQEYQPPTGILS